MTNEQLKKVIESAEQILETVSDLEYVNNFSDEPELREQIAQTAFQIACLCHEILSVGYKCEDD